MSFWGELSRHAEGVGNIQVVLIGDNAMGWQVDDPRRIPEEDMSVLLTPEEAKPLLSFDYDGGFGTADCPPIIVWTHSSIIFVTEYDGSTGFGVVPREPTIHRVGYF